MEVYVVKDPVGRYYEYSEIIIGVFSDKSKVDELVEKRKKKIEENEQKKKKCQSCIFYNAHIDMRMNINTPTCWHNSYGNANIKGKCEGNFEKDTSNLRKYIIETYDLDRLICD